jgi:hypothetical protein
MAQLKAQRDAFLPVWLLRYAELRGRLIQYGKQSPEALRRSQDNLDQIENAIKVRRKQLDTLHDDAFMTQRANEEAALQATVAANPELKAIAGNAWDDIEKAQQTYRNIMLPYIFTEGAAGFNSDLYFHARALVRAAANAASRIPSVCVSTPMRPCLNCGNSLLPKHRFTPTSRKYGSHSHSSACANGSGRTTSWCVRSSVKNRPTRWQRA